MRRVIARSGAAVVEVVETPVAPRNGFLVRAVCSLISPGTELGLIAASSRSDTRPLGYSLAGRVVGAGPEAPAVAEGTLVACAGFEYSYHADFAAVPRLMATAVPPQVSAQAATFTTLGATAIHALRQGRISLGDRVVIVGLGLVGQLAAQVTRAAGARVAAMDLLPSRAALAGRLGAEVTPDPHRATLVDEIREWSGGMGADCVLLCTSGGGDVVNLAARLTRDRGRLVIVGTPPIQVDREAFFARELELTIARAYGPGRYDPVYEREGVDYPPGYVRWTQERNRAEFLRLMADGLVQVEPLITHTFTLDQAVSAYAVLQHTPESAMAVLLTYDKGGMT